MKTALELLGHPKVGEYGTNCSCDYCGLMELRPMLELVAKRAREEMREAASREADYFAENSSAARHIKRAIQALPVEAKP